MATKKFIIEVEEGRTECVNCPIDGWCCGKAIDMFKCCEFNLATMKIKEYETEGQFELHIREKKALKHCIQMAESHISSWQFNDKREKESVRVAKQFLRKLRLLETKKLEEEKCEK